MRKRILMYFLAFALALCTGMTALTVTGIINVKAEEKLNDGTFYYTVTDDGTAVITGLVNPNVSAGINLVIPKKIGTYRVTEIGGNAFKGNKYIKSVTFNEGLKVIGHHAFSGCTNLTGALVLPASLEKFTTDWSDGYAFEGTMIKSLSFASGSDTAIVIPKGTFYNCTYLESVTIPNRVSELGKSAFEGCTNLKNLTINTGLNKLTIGEYAFCNTAFTTVVLPSSVEKLGSHAFGACSRLTKVEFSNGVKEIGDYAFTDCEALTTIVFSEGLTTIGHHAFKGCTSLGGDIVFPSTLVEFTTDWGDGYAFEGTQIASVSFAAGSDAPVAIPEGTFYKCIYLKSVTIPDRVNEIGYKAFAECSNLKTLTFEDGSVTKSIGDNAFENTSVDSVVFTSNISSIGNRAFAGCNNLTKVTFSEGLTSMGYEAFQNCKNLKGDIVIPSTLTSFGEDWGNGKQFENTMINSLSFAEGSVSPLKIAGSLCYNCTSLTSVSIPDRVNVIGEKAFENCSALTEVTFKTGELKKEIQDNAFKASGLLEIDIPGTVTVIGNEAFQKCEALRSVKLNEGLTSLGYSVFENCTSLNCNIVIPSTVTSLGTNWGDSYLFANSAIVSLTFLDSTVALDVPGRICENCSELKYVVLPSRIKSIGEAAFIKDISLVYVAITSNEYFDFTIGENAFDGDYCLKAISIPNRITSIGKDAFKGCSDLKDVYVDKSEDDYNSKCSVNTTGNALYVGATFHFNSKGPDKWPSTAFTGWKEIDGVKYWYEEDIRQGLEGRGKEIFDPETNAWYWLDSVLEGAVAKSKDVYQESEAGQWGDKTNEAGVKIGKWVRYDENGHMIKGWQTTDAGIYYFDTVYGTMAKGDAVIDGKNYYFDVNTGILRGSDSKDDNNKRLSDDGWHKINGVNYWYEGGVRQGYDPNNSDYRGKEIYDAGSDAWYWLDNVQEGAVAKSKDVYQESLAGPWGDKTNEAGEKIGKWVRYDASGHMIKGWSKKDGNTYYFDPTYGTMAKGEAVIDGKTYFFDVNTGILQQ